MLFLPFFFLLPTKPKYLLCAVEAQFLDMTGIKIRFTEVYCVQRVKGVGGYVYMNE